MATAFWMWSRSATTIEVDVLLGTAAGPCQQFANYKTGGDWPLSVTLADINGDGRPDVIVGNECQFTQKGTGKGRCNTVGGVSVLTNKAASGPPSPASIRRRFSPRADFRLFRGGGGRQWDGRPDLAISNLCMSTPNPITPVPTTDGLR